MCLLAPLLTVMTAAEMQLYLAQFTLSQLSWIFYTFCTKNILKIFGCLIWVSVPPHSNMGLF